MPEPIDFARVTEAFARHVSTTEHEVPAWVAAGYEVRYRLGGRVVLSWAGPHDPPEPPAHVA